MLLLCLLLVSGCTLQEETENETETINSIVTWDEDDLDDDYDDEDVQDVTFHETSIAFDGEGASISGTTITITKGGSYKFSGTLDDGSIIVDTTSEAVVRIILDDANITSTSSAPIYVKQADKVLLTLAQDSINSIQDSANYVLDDIAEGEPNATIFSKDDLTINGSGTLEVNANYNNAIQSKDDLKIVSGTLYITAIDDGLVGKDLLAIKDGNITIQSESNAMKTTNEEETDKGNLAIEGGTINITALTDGIQAANELYIYNGEFTITTGGGSTNSSKTTTMNNGMPWGEWSASEEEDSTSAKGLKSTNNMQIENGTFILDTSDDALHTNGTMTINQGTFTILSGDDGMHADTSLTINGATIDIQQSYEGIESGELIFNGGNIHVISSDDGINAAGGNDGSSTDGRAGQNNFSADASKQITINDGYLYIDASGDGIDSNGTVTMTGGTVIVNGPMDGANGALDFDGSFTITGGYLIAAGSSGMTLSPTEITNGNVVNINFTSALSSLIHIQDRDGNNIMTFQPAKSVQSLVLYTSHLVNGNSYDVYTDGTVTGTNTDGYYEDGSYRDGTLYESFTISSTTTTIGTSQGMMGSGPGGNMQGKGGGEMPQR